MSALEQSFTFLMCHRGLVLNISRPSIWLALIANMTDIFTTSTRIFSTERTTFLPRGHRRWRLSMRTPHLQRTTRWRPPTPTTAATGTTPNPTMTPTPTRATMATRARPSPPRPMAHTDTDRPRTRDMATVRWSQRRAQPHCPATRSPRRRRRRRHRSPTAATRSRHPRLWWSPQTLPRPLPPWCAATALWASNRWWRPHTASTRTPTRWARPRWSAWGPCPSWCPPRAEQARWSEFWRDFETKWVFWVWCLKSNDEKQKEYGLKQPAALYNCVFLYVSTSLSQNKLGFHSAEFIWCQFLDGQEWTSTTQKLIIPLLDGFPRWAWWELFFQPFGWFSQCWSETSRRTSTPRCFFRAGSLWRLCFVFFGLKATQGIFISVCPYCMVR